MMISRNLRVMLTTLAMSLLLAELGARALQPHVPGPTWWDSPFAQAKAARAAEVGRTDIVVVGSSIGNANLDPTVLAEGVPWANRGYNAALPAETPRQWEVWAEDVVFPELCPGLLVVAVGPRDTNDNKFDAERALGQYRDSSGRLALYGQAPFWDEVDMAASEVSALVAIRERLREPSKLVDYIRTGSAPGWPSENLAADGRYLGFDDADTFEVDEERDEMLRTGALADYEVGPAEFGALERLITSAQAKGISVVVVDMPYLGDALASLLDDGAADLDRYHEAVDRLAAVTGVPLLRYPGFGSDSEIFADHYHMLGLGTAQLSEMIATDLGFLFPDAAARSQCPPRIDGHAP